MPSLSATRRYSVSNVEFLLSKVILWVPRNRLLTQHSLTISRLFLEVGVASTRYSASSCWYVSLQPQPVGQRASRCNLRTHMLWLPGCSPTKSQKATDRSIESQSHLAHNKLPTKTCYKKLGTICWEIRESQHRPIWRVASKITQSSQTASLTNQMFPFLSMPFKYLA